MREKLLEVLAEPETGHPLQLVARKGSAGVVEDGELQCVACGRSYPIVRGIPRFVPDEGYASSFGMQWNRFRAVQVDSLTGHTHSQRRFDEEAGWDESMLKDRWVLDGGCGAGRFAEVVAARGPNMVALDFSSAVDAAAQTLARFPNVDIVQGNLLCPPFRRDSFDFAYSIGVAQHTPDPGLVVENVVRCVKRGGQFCFSIYARRPWTKLNTKYLIRPITRRMDQMALLRAIEMVMPVAFPLTDRLYRLPILGRLAQFTIPIATYVDREDFDDRQRYEEAILDTFDMLSPRYDSPMTWQEVKAAFTRSEASSWTFKNRVPINVVGVR